MSISKFRIIYVTTKAPNSQKNADNTCDLLSY